MIDSFFLRPRSRSCWGRASERERERERERGGGRKEERGGGVEREKSAGDEVGLVVEREF